MEAIFPDILGLAPFLAIDIETHDPDIKTGAGAPYGNGYICGIAMAVAGPHVKKEESWYFPIAHASGNLDKRDVIAYFKEIARSGITTVGANYVYDLQWLLSEGIDFKGQTDCVQVMESLIDANAYSYKLENLGQKYIGEGKEETELFDYAREVLNLKKVKKPADAKKHMELFPADVVAPYAKQDALLTAKVYVEQLKIIREQDLEEVWELERTLTKLLVKMRMKGVNIDYEKAVQYNEKYLLLEKEALKEASDYLKSTLWVDEPFPEDYQVEPWAPTSLVTAFEALEIDYPLTKEGSPSFEDEFLSNHDHPFCQALSKFRRLSKPRRDFLEGTLIKQSKNGKIYCNFHQNRSDNSGTRTGRISSSGPNLQQQPSRDKEWKEVIRSCYIPSPGKLWARLDYSQQEPRLLVHYAYRTRCPGSEAARQALIDEPDTDFHQWTADMAGVSRSEAKTLNLGRIYGMGKGKIQRQMGVSAERASEVMLLHNQKFPFIQKIQRDCMYKASETGFVRTYKGRRQRFDRWEAVRNQDEWDSMVQMPTFSSEEEARLNFPTRRIQRAMCYKALNALIQGSAADMTKHAMNEVYRILDLVPLIQVHDELNYEVDSIEQALEIKKIMETCFPLEVPLIADLEIGESWGELEPYEV